MKQASVFLSLFFAGFVFGAGALYLSKSFIVHADAKKESRNPSASDNLIATDSSTSPEYRADSVSPRADVYKNFPKCEDQEQQDPDSTKEREPDCWQICRKLYASTVGKKNCEKKAVAQIKKFIEIDHAFKNPSDNNLNYISSSKLSGDITAITSKDVWTYLSISEKPLRDHFNEYTSLQAKRVH